MNLKSDDTLAITLVQPIQLGHVSLLKQLLEDNPGLSTAYVTEDKPDGASRSLLHIATDWPGHFRNVSDTIRALIEAGADVNARFTGLHTETPLHWAASSDDVEALDALLDTGADIEAPGSVLGGGSPLSDATGFGQWNVARRLVERGAKTTLSDAATLGLMDRLEAYFVTGPSPCPDEINRAFWGACHGGRRGAAEYLFAPGAEIKWVSGGGKKTPRGAARRGGF